MAEEAKSSPPESGSGGSSGGKNIILYALLVLNMAVVAFSGFMFYSARKKDAEQAKAIEKVANGAVEDAAGHGAAAGGGEHGEKAEGHGEKAADAAEDEDFVGKMIPLETFLVNLAGNRGSKVLKLNMELEVEGERIADEIDKRKPQIRDIIIIVLSSKTYEQISSTEGKNFLRDEIRDTVNAFLTRGKIKRVHFTELIYQ